MIREAIRQLEVSGLVESRHGGGNYVREVTVEHLVAPIASVLNGMARFARSSWTRGSSSSRR